ncbi:Germin-like protein 9-3 [Camellia lanceoleosa]|uniref:Germin-like protein 9-3 n=1 Tax=Camellia lanceoleosa TaxID=1840588 RepID=A0ACC0H725_9ERIC|nr:Germin-like protein 9-3 [Camellia lanceoleosa]
MASKHQLFFNLVLICTTLLPISMAGDPDILTDFIIPPNAIVNGSLFTFTGMRSLVNSPIPSNFTVLKASMVQFPALEGQSVSYAVLEFPNDSVNPPHTHPRASELLFLLGGSLEVGFVDTTNKLYTQTLEFGDMFVFPKGLVHFQYNNGSNGPALALSAFGSANAGTVSVPTTVFNTSIFDGILAKSFKIDIATVEKLKAGLAH